MGYIGIALLLFAAISGVSILLLTLHFAEKDVNSRRLRVTMPEDLDYTEVFTDVFKQYTSRAELVKVKTTNLGSMFELVYEIALRDVSQEKRFIDELRTRNGNLNIIISRLPANNNEEL